MTAERRYSSGGRVCGSGPAALGRWDPAPDRLDQFRALRETLRLIHGPDSLTVHLDVVHAVIAGDETQGGDGGPELFQDRVRILERLRLVSAGKAVANQNFCHPI